MEKTAALLVIITESKAKGRKATWSPAHKIGTVRGHSCPGRGGMGKWENLAPCLSSCQRRREDTADRIPWEIRMWGLVLEGEGPGPGRGLGWWSLSSNSKEKKGVVCGGRKWLSRLGENNSGDHFSGVTELQRGGDAGARGKHQIPQKCWGCGGTRL